MYHMLPQGGNVVEMVPTPPEHQDNNYYGKGNVEDEGYHNNVRQDYTTVHQDHLVDRTLNNPRQEYHNYNYNRYPFVKESQIILVQEDEGYHYIYQDHLLHENHLRE